MPPAVDAKEEDEEKEIKPLDEEDIALLKTYVRRSYPLLFTSFFFFPALIKMKSMNRAEVHMPQTLKSWKVISNELRSM